MASVTYHLPLALAGCLLLAGAAAPAHAVPIEVSVGPGETIVIDASGDPQDANDTGVRLRNNSLVGGIVSLEFIPGDPLAGGRTVEGPFKLLDGTLVVNSDIPAGQIRAGYRMEYDGRALRARRIDEASVRLFRLDERRKRWGRAIRALRAPVSTRFLEGRATFELGKYGLARSDSYAWSVLDVNSSYALGGLPLPEPASLLLLGAGASLLVLGRRGSRRA